jgi:glycosyltransferase involved in cell wall biosynthesis
MNGTADPQAPTSPPPLISLITPCLDAVSFIGEMLASVDAQEGVAVEHIVLDGGSTDGTREFLAAKPRLRLVAQADAGSHDAMNKGIRLAQGEILAFINSDDLYAPGILAAIAARFAAEPALDAVLGRSYVFARGQGGGWQIAEPHPLCRRGGFDLADLMYGVPCINARFFRRRVFERFGDFSLDFSFAADRHFLLRLALGGISGAVLDRPAYFYRRHAASRTLDAAFRNAAAIGLEHIAIADRLLAESPGPEAARALRAWRAYETLRAELRAHAIPKGGDVAALFRGAAAKLAVRGHRRADAPPRPPDSLLPASLTALPPLPSGRGSRRGGPSAW